MILTKNLKKEYSDKYYTSIDELPIWNWWQIADTSKLSYLRKDENYEEDDFPIELWFKIQNEYLDEFGFTDDFRQIIELRKKWIKKKTDYLVTNNRFNLTEIEIIEGKMSELIDAKIKVDKFKSVILLEKELHREINPKLISVKKYYKYMEYFSNNKNG